MAQRLGYSQRKNHYQAIELFHAAPGGVRTTEPFSQSTRWESLDLDVVNGCIHDMEHAYSENGGLVILRGNLSPDGSVLKPPDVDEELWGIHRARTGVRIPGGGGVHDPQA